MYVNKKNYVKIGQKVFLCVNPHRYVYFIVYVKYIFMEYVYNVKIIYLIL